MAPPRRTAANRQNARQSTGPRTAGGKQRAGSNAFRHGLSSQMSAPAQLNQKLERRAREIAGDSSGPLMLVWCRAAAEAEFDLARVRHAKVALIERAAISNEFDLSQLSASAPNLMPPSEADRLLAFVRRALPELLKIDRYEQRAASRLDHALVHIADLRANYQ